MRNILGLLLIIASIAGLVFIDNETKIFSSKLERFFPPKEEVVPPSQIILETSKEHPFIQIPPTEKSFLAITKRDFIRHHVVLYSYLLEGKEVRFFIIKEGIKQNTKYRAVLDASSASVEKSKGFEYKKNYFISRDCLIEFHKERVGIATGGCNPIVLPLQEDNQMLYISKEELIKALPLF